jgi:hypothetical protein
VVGDVAYQQAIELRSRRRPPPSASGRRKSTSLSKE